MLRYAWKNTLSPLAAVLLACSHVYPALASGESTASTPTAPITTMVGRPAGTVPTAPSAAAKATSVSTPVKPSSKLMEASPVNMDVCQLVDDKQQPLKPIAMCEAENDLFLLMPTELWRVKNGTNLLGTGGTLTAAPCGPLKASIGKIPVQEFANMTYAPERKTVLLLDKSGDIYDYNPSGGKWSVVRPNYPLGSPDPEYIDMVAVKKDVLLLDPERNQIWRYPAAGSKPKYFKDVLPWRTMPGDVNVGDGIGIAYDGNTWVLRKSGGIAKFVDDRTTGIGHQIPFAWKAPKGLRPSRLYTAYGTPLFIVERENNRVIAIDKTNLAARPFVFSSDSDLHGMMPSSEGFWILDGSSIVHRSLSSADPKGTKITPRHIDPRLANLTMPLKNASLPRHAGVWPGARRLYRFGVHKAVDFFNDPGGATYIDIGTPVYAAGNGKISRADANYKDMDATKYSYVIYQCHHQHISSEANEDLLRGCQVWIDHGDGLITKYAHLDRIRPGLKAGSKVSKGELLGYVGVSGTGENLPGRVKHPHLHFEVWLDGKYLGYGLTPPETIAVYEDVFGKRGAHEKKRATSSSRDQ